MQGKAALGAYLNLLKLAVFALKIPSKVEVFPADLQGPGARRYLKAKKALSCFVCFYAFIIISFTLFVIHPTHPHFTLLVLCNQKRNETV